MMPSLFISPLAKFKNQARPVSQVPRWIKLLLPLIFLLQLLWHGYQPEVSVSVKSLPEPLPVDTYRWLSLDEPEAVARYLNLWLQAFDNQPGVSLSFQQLDYSMIIRWLDTILQLGHDTQYPLLVATHIYGSIHQPNRQRIMMDYVFTKFKQYPNKYWRWLAHAVIVAKHELKDQPLAFKYADALASLATGPQVPYWARDMKIILLEDMGEWQAARVLVGGLIESGEIQDPYELKFLVQKLDDLQKK